MPAVASVLPLVPAWRVDRTFDYRVPQRLAGKIANGTLVRIPFGGRVVRGFVLGTSESPTDDSTLEEVKGIVIATPLVVPPFDEVIAAVARRYVVPRGKAFARVVPPRVRIGPSAPTEVPIAVTPERLLRYEGGAELLTALRARERGTWCLQALPGDDRAALISEMVGALPDGAAIVMVPEVRYGSLVLEGLARRFPDIARVDSAQDDGDRSQAWVRMAAGHRLCGGGRGAVFVPAPDLALVVVDEEHHHTYKEDRAPRYDARWVAVERSRRQGAMCVFLSSSPSVETGAATSDGRYGSVRPPRSDRRASRPIVELVDRPPERSLGHDLHERITAALRAQQRVALLAPSPAYARAVWCAGCKRSLRCPTCEAGLFFDRSGPRIRCARCGYSEAAPDTCPACGSAEFRFVGAGTERLAEQLRKVFPRARLHRVDPSDPTDMSSADVDIYLTTWIGTKPALRPDASLVGVLDADWLIRRPDFRSAESAYQAMVEMAEWAGPASNGGRLVIQTAEPNHHALQAVVRADYDYFLRKELEHRAELVYPPFVELVKVTVQGSASEEVVRRVRAELSPLSVQILGPVPLQSNGSPALQLLIKCNSVDPVAKGLRVILEGAPKGARIAIDVDPR